MLLPQSRKQLGMSLAEVMLALAVGAMMTVVALKQYQVFSQDRDVQQVQTNLDILFQALALYYKANCTSNWSYPDSSSNSSRIATGTLDPSSGPFTNNTYPLVDNGGSLIQTRLVTPGFLTKWPVVATEYVDNTAPNQGYVLQFNLINSDYRNSPTSQVFQASDNSYPQMGNIYYWQAQVAVLVRHTGNVATYKQLLRADCTSSLDSSGVTVYPCSAGQSGNYLVWTRLPSGALQQSNSVLWQTTPQLNQFKQQYTHDTYYEFSNTNRGFSSWAQTQYYLCGG